METGTYAGFDVALRASESALLTFNEPEQLNGMTSAMKRDPVEVLLQAQLADEVPPGVREGVSAFFEKRRPHFNRWLEPDSSDDPEAGGA